MNQSVLLLILAAVGIGSIYVVVRKAAVDKLIQEGDKKRAEVKAQLDATQADQANLKQEAANKAASQSEGDKDAFWEEELGKVKSSNPTDNQ